MNQKALTSNTNNRRLSHDFWPVYSLNTHLLRIQWEDGEFEDVGPDHYVYKIWQKATHGERRRQLDELSEILKSVTRKKQATESGQKGLFD